MSIGSQPQVVRKGLQKYKFFEKYTISGTKFISCAQKIWFCYQKP